MPHLADEERTDLKQIIDSLQDLTGRIDRMEKYLGLQEQTGDNRFHQATADEQGLELKVGEYGLAWAGSIILFLGIIFLMTFTYSKGHVHYASLVGFAAAAVLYVASRVWRKTIPHLSRLMAAGTTALLFYSTLRLHFYTSDPLIHSFPMIILMLGAVVCFQFYQSIALQSQTFAAMGVFLALITALLVDHSYLTFALVTMVAASAMMVSLRLEWKTLPVLAVLMIYLTHLLWLLNNPVAGHPLRIVPENHYSLVYLLVCGAILSWPLILFNKKVEPQDPLAVTTTILNCLGLSFIAAIAIVFRWSTAAAICCFLVAFFFLTTSILQWIRTRLQLPASIFASFGFLALSISIALHEPFPAAFFWLALQSLLVLSLALWFRSKTLVVVNCAIYLVILLSYVFVSPLASYVNFTFAFVALFSARILNWQKDRLILETSLLRNFYLTIGFVLILFSLYKAVPPQYVTLSWTAAAVGYFFLSYVLKNVKYRWMGTLALILTVFYLLIVDLPRLDMRFRIVAFLFLGVMALIISLFYTKIRHILTAKNTEGPGQLQAK